MDQDTTPVAPAHTSAASPDSSFFTRRVWIGVRLTASLLTVVCALWWFIPQLSAGPGVSPAPDLTRTLPFVDTVAQRYSVPGYSRDKFGHGWARQPATGPGCTTRDRELFRVLANKEFATDSCRLRHGETRGPYTGHRIGVGIGKPIELDHVFPLAAAWDMGAHAWDDHRRLVFANDPINLVVVGKKPNRDKSDSLPSVWLPPDRKARCWYARRVAYVAAVYGLPLPKDDRRVIERQCRFAPAGQNRYPAKDTRFHWLWEKRTSGDEVPTIPQNNP